PCPATDDCRVVPIQPVAMELDEVGEDGVDIVERVGTAGMPGDLHALHRRQILIDVETQRGKLLFERADVLRHIRLLTGDAFQLLDLFLQLEQRFLEIQCVDRHSRLYQVYSVHPHDVPQGGE